MFLLYHCTCIEPPNAAAVQQYRKFHEPDHQMCPLHIILKALHCTLPKGC